MNASAIVMLLIGLVGLWGTLVAAIVNYLRKAHLQKARQDRG